MKRKLTVIESSVLEFIPRGMSNRKNLTDISKLIDLDVRSIQGVINRLISYGVPIVASRSHNKSGVYIATSQEEVVSGVKSIKSQIEEMKIRVYNVENADLDKWPSLVETSHQVKLEV
ncbi:hypothetical protein [Vagococcus fluvialis]|uniref:hypothetical protein n=1 Tax=Vagococcus fluvialis TaxID=2738 RepID=UPI003B21F3B3